MKKIILTIALLITSLAVYAEDKSHCLSPNADKSITTTLTNGEVAQQVLCCCRTYNGGQCCNYVSFCSGSLIPGCMCSGHSIDAEPDAIKLDDSKINS
jgi:hypothetical protein